MAEKASGRATSRREKQQQLKSARGQLTSAEGKYEGAAAQLAYTEIRSPIDGVVTDRPSYPGETPPPGVAAADRDGHFIGDRARPHSAERSRSAEARRQLRPSIAPGDVQVTGKVTLVSPALDPNSTTVEVWVEAANPDGRLRPGTTVTSLSSQTFNDAVVVPTSALLKTPEGDSTVMIVSGDHAHQVSVETGIRQGDRVQITKGLSWRRDRHRHGRLRACLITPR